MTTRHDPVTGAMISESAAKVPTVPAAPSDAELDNLIEAGFRGIGLSEAAAQVAAGRRFCAPRTQAKAPTVTASAKAAANEQDVDAVISESLRALGCPEAGLKAAVRGRGGIVLLSEEGQ